MTVKKTLKIKKGVLMTVFVLAYIPNANIIKSYHKQTTLFYFSFLEDTINLN